jgi:hypothetical protein
MLEAGSWRLAAADGGVELHAIVGRKLGGVGTGILNVNQRNLG